MTTIESHKDHIKNIQIDSINKTQEILRMLDDSQNNGSKSLELLDKQYEQLEKINNTHDTINENLDKSSTILGKIKYFFFPRKVTNIEKINNNVNNINSNNITDSNNIKDSSNINNSTNINKLTKNKSISIKSNEFVDKTLEDQIDNNIDEINIGVSNLKNIALEMNFALDRDKQLLDKINNKSEIVTTNMKKINKEINKLL
jgi:tetrahydromethanopterin S-methyltransferase subunit B